jgi:hypothetical protein
MKSEAGPPNAKPATSFCERKIWAGGISKDKLTSNIADLTINSPAKIIGFI